jgi:hypothetical protein
MPCFGDFLSTNIGGCTGIAGARSNAYLIPRASVAGIAFYDSTDVYFTFTAADVIPVYMPMRFPYQLVVESARNDMGLTKHNKSVQLFLVSNTPITQKQVMQLKTVPYVLLYTDNNGQDVAVGMERGLEFQDSSQDLNSTDTYGGIMVTMSEQAVNIPMVFAPFVGPVPVTAFALDGDSVSLPVGDDQTIDCIVVPGNSTVRTVYTVVENPFICTATWLEGVEQLEIIGLGAGTTIVNCFTLDGNYKASFTVTVVA